jgi:hypothetical protein
MKWEQWRFEKNIQKFGLKNLNDKDIFGDPDKDGSII